MVKNSQILGQNEANLSAHNYPNASWERGTLKSNESIGIAGGIPMTTVISSPKLCPINLTDIISDEISSTIGGLTPRRTQEQASYVRFYERSTLTKHVCMYVRTYIQY